MRDPSLTSKGLTADHVYEAFRKELKSSNTLHQQNSTKRMNAPISAVNWFKLAKTWDQGSRSVRERILVEFIRENKNKTGPQLERDFGNSASLFLVRITSWLRLTYLLGFDLAKMFQAIEVFVSASSGQRYLLEFMEIGGILTTLEVLGISKIRDTEKTAAMKLLQSIAHQGRKYKEFVCESYGVRAISDCLLRSTNEETQDCARCLLHDLGQGNPKYITQIIKSLMIILTSKLASPTSQQLAAQALRMLLPSMTSLQLSIIDASINLLKSIHIQVQYEGYELLRALVNRSQLQEQIITQLISLLRPHILAEQTDTAQAKINRRESFLSRRRSSAIHKEEQNLEMDPDDITAAFVQQAYAAKLLGVIAATHGDLCEKMVEKQAIHGLLYAISNSDYPDAQHYAANTIMFLAEEIPEVQNSIKEGLGYHIWELFESHPDTFYMELSKDQLKMLRKSQIWVSRNPVIAEVDSRRTSLTSTFEVEDEQAMTTSVTEEGLGKLAEDEGTEEPASVGKEADRFTVEKPTEMGNHLSISNDEIATNQPVIKELYKPLMSVDIHQTLSGNKKGDESDEIDVAAKFKVDLDGVRENVKQNNILSKLGMERKVEVDLTLNTANTSHLSRLSDPNVFKTDIGNLIKTVVATVSEDKPNSAPTDNKTGTGLGEIVENDED